MKIFVFIILSLASSAYADGESVEKFQVGNLKSDLVGRSLESLRAYRKSLGEGKEMYPEYCKAPMQNACKEKFGEYCSCFGFNENQANKNLEARTYVVAEKNGKIVEVKMNSGLMPVHIVKSPKDEGEPLRLRSFSEGKKPDRIHFSGVLNSFERGGRDTDFHTSQFTAVWSLGETEVAANIWCIDGKVQHYKGKFRDCYVYEAAYSSIRKFNPPTAPQKDDRY